MTTKNRTLLPRFVVTDEPIAKSPAPCFALCRLFSDGMVLQCGQPNWVWGTAPAGAAVSVEIDGRCSVATANGDGKWKTRVAPLPVGGPYVMTVRCGDRTFTVDDILSGEVWLCAGQSNMEWPLANTTDADAQIAAADFPEIRCYGLSHRASDVPLDTLPEEDGWCACTPENARWFSAIGYYFARDLQRDLGVPVGLVDNSYGGTCAEAWVSVDAIRSEPGLRGILERHAEKTADQADYERRLATWREDAAAWNQVPESEQVQWKTMLKWWQRIRPPYGHPWNVEAPGHLFNANTQPLIPFGIKGILWYQGESNAERANEYRLLLSTLIRDWRTRWGQADLPFLVVQLANCGLPPKEPGPAALAELRAAQLATVRSSQKTALVVTIDVGEAANCHPSLKEPVGHRLYLAALKTAYGRDVVASGPVRDRVESEGRALRCRFSSVGGGLVAQGGGPLKHFALAGTDGMFVWADARIDGDTVVVHSSAVPEPVAVRYAWSRNPEGCNLYNREGLPASPFEGRVAEARHAPGKGGRQADKTDETDGLV